ncbi:MAG: type II toxin-antitoxin system RelE/ParE family toxin [Patescibacteria group bacterium]|nr:type II toxin-antitoxin system RelE/ParE family toxin [Patescibacteria group bacterium]
MDRIKKFLKKLSRKEREIIAELMCKVITNDLSGLVAKKLSGNSNLYRVRVGRIRIVFEKREIENKIINMDYRKDVCKNI